MKSLQIKIYWVIGTLYLLSFSFLYFRNSLIEYSFSEQDATLVLLFHVALLIAGLFISIKITSSLSRTNTSLGRKLIYGFILNLLVFASIILIWIAGGNTAHDDKGLITVFIIIPSSTIFAIAGFIVASIFSIRRRNMQDFQYQPKYGHILIITFIGILLFYSFTFKDEILSKIAVSLNNENYCPSLNSPLHSNCVNKIIRTKATTNLDVSVCIKDTVPSYCVMTVASRTKNQQVCEYLDGGINFKKEFEHEVFNRDYCLYRGNPEKSADIWK